MNATKIGLEGMDWIDVATDKQWWLALVNMVITVGLHRSRRNSSLLECDICF
jgi:hypothetical protein